MKPVPFILMIAFLFGNYLGAGEEVIKNEDSDDWKIDTFTKCYDEIGCIETDPSWYDEKLRPVNLQPVERHIIKTDFLLMKYDKAHPGALLYNSMMAKYNSIKAAGFNGQKDVLILIHDFTGNGYTGWIKHVAKIMLSKFPDINIVSVDWQRGAEPPYDQAISNARVVALEIIALLKELKEKYNNDFEKVHIIGHGVGAHIAGYVGATYNNLKKITALDPSGPRFEGLPDVVKLNPTNAKYIEVIHTDADDSRSQGTRETMGHSDFYINNANTQPGCSVNESVPELLDVERNTLNEGDILPGCSHKRAFKYFIEALAHEECAFLGIKCDSYEDFNKGSCTGCGKSDLCRRFGLAIYKSPIPKTMLYLNVADVPPYCMFQYKVTISVKQAGGDYHGYFDFILVDDKTHVSEVSLADKSSKFRDIKSGSSTSFIYYAQAPKLGKLKEAKVRWNEKKKIYCFIYCKQEIGVEKIAFKFLGTGRNDEGKEEFLCPSGGDTEIENGSYKTFVGCPGLEKATSKKPKSTTHSATSKKG